MLKKGIESPQLFINTKHTMYSNIVFLCTFCLTLSILADVNGYQNRNAIPSNKRELTDNTCISSVSGSSVALCVNPAAGTLTNSEYPKISFFFK